MTRPQTFMLLGILSVGATITWILLGDATPDWHTYVFSHRDATDHWIDGYYTRPPLWWYGGIGGWFTLSVVLFFFAVIVGE